jgi:hypothetical protein
MKIYHSDIKYHVTLIIIFSILQVRDDPKLLEDGGEIPKSQERDRRFDSRL